MPAGKVPLEASTAADAGLRAGERRQITALFYDLVDSTRLTVSLDPEDMRDLQRSFHRACIEAIQRHGGYVERFMGDGGAVYFGYPRAQEDAAERAVRAGLAIVGACRELRPVVPIAGEGLAVRVGIATGLAVVGVHASTGSSTQDEIVGVAPNLAARLQSVAAPNSILVSESTWALTRGLFEYEAAGDWELKGFSGRQSAWRAITARRTDDRFEALRPNLVPFLARDEEVGRLLDRWQAVKAGGGQVVLLSGEPGIGKSRLIAHFRNLISGEPHFRITFQCSSQGVDTPLHPVIQQLAGVLEGTGPASPAEMLQRLESLLEPTGGRARALAPFFASLLDLPIGHQPELARHDPEWIKQRTLDAILAYLEGLSARRPMLLIFEDVQWIDPTSQDLLDRIVDWLAGRRVLVIVSIRPGYPPSWVGRPNLVRLSLSRLPRTVSGEVIDYVAGETRLPEPLKEKIIAQTDGVPLFLEEITRFIVERLRGQRSESVENLLDPSAESEVVVSLADSLAARLDQLEAGKEIAQIASVIGRSFSSRLLKLVAGREEVAVDEALARMVELDLVHRRAARVDADYGFKHALIQDAAYSSMLRRERQSVHKRIALALKAGTDIGREPAADVLALHLERGGMAEEAIEALQIAARHAAERSANREVVRLLERAFRLVRGLPESTHRDAIELDLTIAIGPALMNLSGSGAPEVRELYERGLELCRRLPRSPRHFTLLWGWWYVAPDFKTMRERADRLLDLARNLDNEELELQAHHCQWATLFNLGEHTACCAHVDQGLVRYESGDYRSHSVLYGGHDPKVCGLGEKALSLWLQGFPLQALDLCRRSVAHAEQLQHRGSISHAQDIEIMLHRYRGDAAAVGERARAMMDFAEEQGFKALRAKAKVFEGWARAKHGDPEAGVRLIEEGLDIQRGIGTEEDFPVYYEMLAEAQVERSGADDGTSVLDSAIEMAERTGLKYWLPELHRRKGLLLLRQGPDASAALACFEAAATLAEAQGAKTLGLRALTDLASISGDWQDRPTALRRLADAYAALREGFDTADLVRARQLLDKAGTRHGS